MTFRILGDEKKLPSTVNKDIYYFQIRDIFLDTRGTLIVHKDSTWGWNITVMTRSHDFSGGGLGKTVDRAVIVEKDAFIGSSSLLYNCTVSEGAIVAAGAVVASCYVAPHVIVAGNPAKVVARWVNGEWKWSSERFRILD